MRVQILAAATGVAVAALPVAAAVAGSASGHTTRVSVSTGGGDPDGASTRARISHDGTHVCWESDAHNLVSGKDTNGVSDVYWAAGANTAHPTIKLVSASAKGAVGKRPSTLCDLSSNGRFVIFSSLAGNLVPGYTHPGDIYLKDMTTGAIRPVGTSSKGAVPNGLTNRPVISDDGSIIAFNSNATNLVPGHTHAGDVYVRKIYYSGAPGNSAIARVGEIAVVSSGETSEDDSLRPEISGDGTHVAFASDARLTSNDRNNSRDVYEANISRFRSNPYNGSIPTADLKLVSVSSGGSAPSTGKASRPGINHNGSYVTFESSARLTNADTNFSLDAYERNTATGVTKLVSVDPSGHSVTGESTRPQTDDSGRYVAFVSPSARLVRGDTNHRPDAFLRDMTTGTTTVISVDPQGNPAGTGCGSSSAAAPSTTAGRPGHDNIATRPYLSGNAKHVVFVSGFCDLVAGDHNGINDIFLRTYTALP